MDEVSAAGFGAGSFVLLSGGVSSKALMNALFDLALGGWLFLSGLGGARQVREAGIWYDGRLYRWQDIRGYSWEGSGEIRLHLRSWWRYWRRSLRLSFLTQYEGEVVRLLAERGIPTPAGTRF